MQGLSDAERINSLEMKIDQGFADMRAEFKTVRDEMRTEIEGAETGLRTEIKGVETGLRTEIIAARSDGRADFRTLIAVVFSLWVATVLAVVSVLVAHL
jgi:hypothetical protein